jgi:hypothetical protein
LDPMFASPDVDPVDGGGTGFQEFPFLKGSHNVHD